jgi:D-tyrosyl-tRNA(Tyr) deacylase
MIGVIQRVTRASVTIANEVTSSIGKGLLIFVGIEEDDDQEDIDWLALKIINLRIFNDEQGIMNDNILKTKGDVLVVSQFTLHASTKKGNRPSYSKAAKPTVAIPIYSEFVVAVERNLGKPIQTGTFGADMKVDILNDGPVTIIIDTKHKV